MQYILLQEIKRFRNHCRQNKQIQSFYRYLIVYFSNDLCKLFVKWNIYKLMTIVISILISLIKLMWPKRSFKN